MTLHIIQDDTADEILATDPFALLCGMVLLEDVPIETAFAGATRMHERLGDLDPARIERMSSDDFATVCAQEPAVHPYAESMSVLVQALARAIVGTYEGDTASLWNSAESGKLLLSRLMSLPGFSKRKAQMFVALLGKQLDVRPPGWEEAAGRFSEPGAFRSVADVTDPETLEKVQEERLRRRDERGVKGEPREQTDTSSTIDNSKGPGVNTEENADNAERTEARKARKAAKRAAKQEANASSGETEAGAEKRGGRRGAKRAAAVKAKKAAKRAAKKAARAGDPDAPAKKGGGRGANGRAAKKSADNRRPRKRATVGGRSLGGERTDRDADGGSDSGDTGGDESLVNDETTNGSNSGEAQTGDEPGGDTGSVGSGGDGSEVDGGGSDQSGDASS